MAIHIEFLNENNLSDYRMAVLNCPNALVQHTLEWRQVIIDIGQDNPIYFIAKNSDNSVIGVLPAFLYKCDLGSILTSIPHAGGYGGVVIMNPSYKEEIYKELLESFFLEAKKQSCVLATILTPPFFSENELYRKYFKPDFERENFYQYIFLQSDPFSHLISKKRRNLKSLKRNIKKAEENGLKITFNDNDDLFNAWYKVHEKRMRELGTEPLPLGLFIGMRKYIIKDDLGFFAYILDDNKVIGGAAFVGLNQVLDIFMMSTDSDYFKKDPNYLFVYETLNHAIKRGYKYFNWQSCSSRSCGVYEFKTRWGSQEGLQYYMTKITGDISNLMNTPLNVIKDRYRWHYVMPYEQFNSNE